MAAPSPLTLEAQTYLGWDAWHIQRGPIELVLVPQVGGRLMRLAWNGTDIVFTHPEWRGHVEPVAQAGDWHRAKQDMGFRLWGGEKTWLAPQTRWTDGVPFLDLDSGSYAFEILLQTSDAIHVRMTSPVCRETGMQVTRTLLVTAEKDGIEIVHELHNTTQEIAEWGLWSVSQLLKPASVYLPRHPNSQHPDGVKTFVEEGESDRVRPQVIHPVGTLARIDCQDNVIFKFGTDATEGWLLAICDLPDGHRMGYLTTYHVFENRPYGHGCTAEVFNHHELPYFEAEIHSPMMRLQPQGRMMFYETRQLFAVDQRPVTETDVRRLIAS